jgi:outer membrane lipase/esterase
VAGSGRCRRGKADDQPRADEFRSAGGLFRSTAIPSNQPGGTNYATSGAKNLDVNTNANGGFQQAIPTVTQIGNYLAATGGHANSNALYLISSGGNDVAFALGNSGIGPYPADPTAYILNAANGLAGTVAQLQAAGGRYILVPDLPFSFPTNDATERQARLTYSLALWSALAADGVNFIPADWNAVRVAIAGNPASFGFQFIGNGPAQVACVQNQALAVNSASALLCSSNPAAPYTLVTPTRTARTCSPTSST